MLIELIIKHAVAGIYLLAGSISDIKQREVADWANYGLITIGIMSNIIFSIYFKNWNFIINSLLGFGVFLGLALIMFYAGQWGGGDAKMLMGIGALYGLGFSWQDSLFLISFLINTLIAGAVYGIVWSIVVAVINRKNFIKEYKKLSSAKYIKLLKIAFLVILLLTAILFFTQNNIIIKFFPIAVLVLAILTLYLWILIKAVENSCMYKFVTPDKLTEGDWIAKVIKYKGKYITGPKDLGIEKKQIAILKKLYKENKIKKVLIKEGIPFVPSFLLGWVMSLAFGNILRLIIYF